MREVDTETLNVQAYWEVPVPPPSTAAGMHRFALGAAAGRGGGGGRGAAGMQPGQYTARLTVDGQTLTQPVMVKPDPRISGN
jgi:hypothetical protein